MLIPKFVKIIFNLIYQCNININTAYITQSAALYKYSCTRMFKSCFVLLIDGNQSKVAFSAQSPPQIYRTRAFDNFRRL